MPRLVSEKVRSIQFLLRQQIEQGIYQPGARFLSTRALASKCDISYQTAHRILAELVQQGLLETRHGSGTYLAGASSAPKGGLLLFNPRARRRESFGFHLKRLLERGLRKAAIPYRTAWTAAGRTRYPNLLPIYWELALASDQVQLVPDGGYALLLNDRNVTGLEASRVDTISTDDYSGGVCAAEILRDQAQLQAEPKKLLKRVMVLAASDHDLRSQDRVAGFRSLLPVTPKRVIQAGSWSREDGMRVAGQLFSHNPTAIFCCNDRLAEGVIDLARQAKITLPPMVGFDNAPVAEKLNLTTIAVPWGEIIETAVEIIKKRMAGSRTMGRHQIFAPSPIMRTGPM